ncbi:O-antigen ligase family protein [Halocatena pleomorpha]|nr:O-antigen ligase family protein [Halocatena pleomorpha]
MLVLLGVVFRRMGPGFPQPGRAAKLTLITSLFFFFIFVSPRQQRYLQRAGIFLLAFVVLFSVHLFYVMPIVDPATSGTAAFFIIAGFMTGLNLFVIPRYVPRNAFLWTVSFFSAALMLLGFLSYSGAFSFFGLPVAPWDRTFTPMFVDSEVYILTSVFPNPNTLGVVGFAGTIASVLLVTRAFPRRKQNDQQQQVHTDGGSATVSTFPFVVSLGLSFVAGALFVVNAFGTYLTNSRASYFAVGTALALYSVYLIFGRRALPFAVVGLIGSVFLFILLMPVLGISSTGRFELWAGSIAAAFDGPLLFGRGLVAVGDTIAPYVSGSASGYSPHNSYLSILIRTGVIGFSAYVFIVVGSLFRGVFQSARVDVPALVLAFGFATHQIFEAYTIFHHTLPAVLASLSAGYLIMNGAWVDVAEIDERERRRRNSRGAGTSAWSRPEWER